MKTFKQYLNALEKKRKLDKLNSPKDGVMPVYVHGSHAKTPTIDNSFPNYVHGKHASTKVNEESEEVRNSGYRNVNDWFDEYNKNANEGKGINSLDAELREHYDGIAEHPDRGDLYSYTRGSTAINDNLIYLHTNNKDLSASPEEHRRKINGIDKIVSSTPAPRDFDTFSGLGFDPRRHMDENNVLSSPAYISSSINPQIAYSFAKSINKNTGGMQDTYGYEDSENEENHILRIPIRKSQTNGAYINGRGISHFGFGSDRSGEFGEQEFLHKRGQRFKIDPTPQVLTSAWSKAKTHIWTATPHEED